MITTVQFFCISKMIIPFHKKVILKMITVVHKISISKI